MSKLHNGWMAVPALGTFVSADHPITCLNPDKYFKVGDIQIEKTVVPGGSPFSVRGRSTCWFGSNGVKPVPENVIVREAGFDITKFKSPDDFKKLINSFELDYLGQNRENNNCFMFGGKTLSIHTANHPITGKGNRKGDLEISLGFAGYIGIVGVSEAVEACCYFIKEECEFYKDFSPNSRDYI